MKDIVTGIYIIKNTINGKIYVGQSVNIHRRWNDHKKRYKYNNAEQNSLLHKAFRKYGIENFVFEILEKCSKDELNSREQYWIVHYQSNDRRYGYNITEGGNNGVPNILCKDQVLQIQNALLTTSLTQCEIAKQFNVSQRMISYINSGDSWFDETLKYPLRIFDKRTNYCIVCGKEIALSSTRCNACTHMLKRKVVRPTQDDLLNLIKTQSFSSIGRMFNVSPTTIRRWCKNYGIPYTKTEINSSPCCDAINQ